MELNDIREQIDIIDAQLVDLFIKRMKLCARAGALKARSGLPIKSKPREEDILRRTAALAQGDGLTDETRGFFISLIEISRAYQERLQKFGANACDTD